MKSFFIIPLLTLFFFTACNSPQKDQNPLSIETKSKSVATKGTLNEQSKAVDSAVQNVPDEMDEKAFLKAEEEVVKQEQQAMLEKTEIQGKKEGVSEKVEKVDAKIEKEAKSVINEAESSAESIVNRSKEVVETAVVPKPESKAESKVEQVKIEVENSTEVKVAKASPDTEVQIKKSPTISHDAFNVILNTYVSNVGNVDYAGLKKDVAKLDAYISYLQENPIDPTWTRNRRMAYWLNAYNAFTLKLILDNYPLASITDLDGGKVWDRKWISLNGQTLSLNNIENDIIRPEFNDARIHFAVNCAAVGCPPLANHAFTEANLDRQLDIRTKKFVNSSANEIGQKNIKISKIFDWYSADFKDLTKFLKSYSGVEISPDVKIEYLEYDWSLNGK